MTVTEVLMFGAIAGLLPDIVRIAKAKGNLKDVGGLNVLISMIALAILGAFASYLADIFDKAAPTVVASLTAGFSGPEVISRLLGGTSGGGGGGGGGGAGPEGAPQPESLSPTAGVTRWWRV